MILRLAASQVDVIELDGFPILGSLPCANPAHSHPPGGGNWWSLGHLSLFHEIKSEARRLNPGIVFNAEGMAEIYLSFLDQVWNPFTTGLSPGVLSSSLSDTAKFHLIPQWHSVYHEKALIQSGIAFVNHVDFAAVWDFYVFGFARALVWGEVPTTWWNYTKLNDLSEPGAAEMAAYLKRIVEARGGYASRFLVRGRMLKPPEISVPSFRNPGAKQIPYTLADYPPFDTPAVLASLWQAPGGDVGYVFTNISHDPVSFAFAIEDGPTLLPPKGTYDVGITRNGDYSTLLSSVKLPAAVKISVDPREVLLVTVTPSGGTAASTISPVRARQN